MASNVEWTARLYNRDLRVHSHLRQNRERECDFLTGRSDAALA